ncbi:hypothetical protein CBR_g23841 [Chara braunii]|uniref:Uncharacterized protein n=1 Tax=Chara braunii TaxID=69332 RepID=A0A388JVQ8_CHABU|nr:hypothetical protein CBR_g23841 [Chara braunii]|eukprot:GBG61891.1 hypothetical protein CBR_g23841 [Chara braunii]
MSYGTQAYKMLLKEQELAEEELQEAIAKGRAARQSRPPMDIPMEDISETDSDLESKSGQDSIMGCSDTPAISGASTGVAIWLPPSSRLNPVAHECDRLEGRWVYLKAAMGDEEIVIASVYDPNDPLDRLKAETARRAEATKAELLALLGRQFIANRDDARREEARMMRRPQSSRRRETRDEELGEVDDIDDEIRRLYTLREKRKCGKTPMAEWAAFRQTAFNMDGSVADDARTRAECSMQAEDRRKKVPAGGGPDGILHYILEQRRTLEGLRQDQLKKICADEGLHYCTKGPSIDRIIVARTRLAYEGFVLVPTQAATASPPPSPENAESNPA